VSGFPPKLILRALTYSGLCSCFPLFQPIEVHKIWLGKQERWMQGTVDVAVLQAGAVKTLSQAIHVPTRGKYVEASFLVWPRLLPSEAYSATNLAGKLGLDLAVAAA
jgi:hypothetical protein